MTSILDEYSAFGVTVFMPSCSFQAEVSRKGIPETLAEMDTTLANMGIEDTPDARILAIMNNALTLSADVGTEPDVQDEETLDQDTLIAELSYAFLFAYFKRRGEISLEGLRGITCTLIEDALMFKASETDDAYLVARQTMRDAAAKLLGLRGIRYADYEDATPPKGTIH